MIHDCTRLHSTGSQMGSSSVKHASIKNKINNPRRYKNPSPKVRLKVSKRLISVFFKKLCKVRIKFKANKFIE